MRLRALVCSTALLLFGALLTSPVQAQYQDASDLSDLRQTLRFIGSEYADGYLQPVTDAFGANMNSGLFRTADVGNGVLPLLPVDIYIGVSVSAVPTASLDKRFTPPASETTPDGNYRVSFVGNDPPTAFGPTETPDDADLAITDTRTGFTETQAAPPGLLDTPLAPLAVPQVGIGSLVGTDLQVRYFPKVSLYGYGKVGLFGVSLRHDLDQWIPLPIPFNIAAQGTYQQFSLESGTLTSVGGETSEVLDATGWAANLQVSRGIPVLPILVYGGVQYETFNAEYNYSFSPPAGADPIQLTVDQGASNQLRALAGISVSFAVLRFNIDYSVSAQNTLTAGFGVRL